MAMKYQVARDPEDARERFVWVNDDGSLRELSRDECAYLATPFEGFDGGRPYIKERYRSLTPDGRMRGFLELRHLPEELHHRVRRGGGAPPPTPPSFLDTRAVGHALGIVFAAILAGYLALIVGAFLALPFMRPGYRGLGIVLFVVALFFSLPFYLIFGPINVLLTADSLRFVRFFATTAGWLGAIAGAIWVLWLRGDPSRILLFR
jgi:hypothetical protein